MVELIVSKSILYLFVTELFQPIVNCGAKKQKSSIPEGYTVDWAMVATDYRLEDE